MNTMAENKSGIVPIWTSVYSVGHPLLDSQHQRLLSLCQLAVNCMENGAADSMGESHILLNELVEYAHCHFKTEEQLLADSAYPFLDQHKKEHEAFRTNLAEHLYLATVGKLDKEHLYYFLSDWWQEHILSSDMQYREHLTKLD